MYRSLVGLSFVAGASAQCLPPLRSNYDFKGVGPDSTTPFDLKWQYESATDYFMSHYDALKAAAQAKVDSGDSTDLSSAMADVGTEKGIATDTVQAAQGLLASCASTPGATCERAATMAYICGDSVPTIVCDTDAGTVTATYADPQEYSVSVEGNTWSVKYSNGAVLATGSVGTPASTITPITQQCVSDGLCTDPVSIALTEDILPTSDANLKFLDPATGTSFVLDYEESSARDYFHTLYLSGKAALGDAPLPSSFAAYGEIYDPIYTNTYNACPEVDGTADTTCEKDTFLAEMCDKGPTLDCSTAGVVKASYLDGDAYRLDNDESTWAVKYNLAGSLMDKTLVTASIGSGAASITPMTQADANNPVSVTLAQPFEPLYLDAYNLNTDETDVSCPFGTVSASCTDSLLSLSGCFTNEADWVAVDADKDGALDGVDAFPNDASETLDTDGDGSGDNADAFPNDASETADSDLDGTGDNADGCPNDAAKTAAGQCGCGNVDTDNDGDGTANCNDACPDDAAKIAAGICGCGESDADSDDDGTADCDDACPDDTTKTAAGICGCGVSDADTDEDGTADCIDAFPNDISESVDTDGDGIGDNADVFPNDDSETVDTDGDLTGDNADGCPNDAAKTVPGACGCGNAPKANFWCAGGVQTEHQKCGVGEGVPAALVDNLPTDQAFTCEVCGDLDHKYSLIEDYSGCADHTPCPAGQEPKDKDGSSNPGCQACDSESFTTDTDYAACTDKLQCSSSQYEVSPGSTTENRQCATKVCTCSNGTPVSATTCSANGAEQCGSCNTNFAISGVQCLVDTDGDNSADVDDDDDDNDTILDVDEAAGCTLLTDCDGDGILDQNEADGSAIGKDCRVETDCDGDGVLDQNEADGSALGKDCRVETDCDGDTIEDQNEGDGSAISKDCRVESDCDGDTILDQDESDGSAIGKDCTVLVDCDGDGVNDIDEPDGSSIGKDCRVETDCDGDGLTDLEEIEHNTDPLHTDSDGDGLTDGEEVEQHNTEPDAADTDGDGLSDSSELNDGNVHTHALSSDTDGDGVSDKDDLCHGVDDNDCCFAQKELGNRYRYIELQCCSQLSDTALCDRTSAV